MGRSNKRAHTDMESDIDKTAAGPTGSASAGGFGEDMGPEVMIYQPKNFENTQTFNFEQVHRFTSKGLPYTPMVGEANVGISANNLLMITPLANIPWDRPYMYMSPGDYNNLPPGSHATECHISITCRNPQIGFETGSTTTETATLNHNKHIITAVGLNKRIQGTNRLISYGDTSPMKPTATATDSAEHAALHTAMYGYKNSLAASETTVPASLMGVDIELDAYYCLWGQSKAYVDGKTGANDAGWPSLIEHVQERNMNNSIGHIIMDESYTFKACPLTAPLESINMSAVDDHDFMIGSKVEQMSSCKVSNLVNATPGVTTFNVTGRLFNTPNVPVVGYEDVMEKGASMQRILTPHGIVPIQPSIHVAMKPIPKISGVIKDKQPTEWTTVNAFYEVKTHLTVVSKAPNHYAHSKRHNVENEEQYVGTKALVNTNVPVIFNQYSTVYG